MINVQYFKKFKNNIYAQAIAAVLVTLAVALFIRYGGTKDSVAEDPVLPAVKVSSAAALANPDTVSLIGTVRAFTEAQITAEQSGRVTSVTAELGGRVAAGQVIATLENASERAAVLQAQGVYEAALAASAQSGVGVSESKTALENAENNAVSTFRQSYNSANNIVFGSIDTFFSNPQGTIPGLKIDGNASYLNGERVAFQSILKEWQSRSSQINTNSNLRTELQYARTQTERTIAFVDSFITIFNSGRNIGGYTEAELQSFSASFTQLRSQLINNRSAIDSALTTLSSGEDAIRRAEIASSGGTVSASDAQIKQALGSLRAAQANLAKTILRSPISGTVNSLDIKLGDFVNSFDTVSVIANNNALEIVTYVGDLEKDQISEGETVLIEGEYEGIITQIAPAVDQQTKKTEVRIATDNTNIANGDTVRITKQATSTSVAKDSALYIPITAIKFETTDGSVFVVENDMLVSKPVKIGIVRGSRVEILEGLSDTDEFVLDARGLSAGTKVQVNR